MPIVDPDICLKVDSGLAYCGCTDPSIKLRQFLYIYHESVDFDHQTLKLLVRVFAAAGDDTNVWGSLVGLEFQRDCGLYRDAYLAELLAIVENLEAVSDPLQDLLTA